MRNKKIAILVSIVLTIVLVLSACASEPDPTSAPTITESQSEGKSLKLALVLSGPISDASWNAAAYNAVTELKGKFDLEFQYTENVDLPDIEPVYRDYASKNFDVIIGHGFQFGDPAVKVAPEFRDTKFGIIQGIVEESNVESLNFKGEEEGYLAGILAASMSKTGTIGAIGGEEIPSIIVFVEAYKLGAKSVNPDIKVLTAYVGSWIDPTAGMEAANAQVNNGADVLYPIANLTSQGVYQAAKERDVMAIATEGVPFDVAPENILASQTENLGPVIEIMLNNIIDGSFQGGVKYYGHKEGAISFDFNAELIPNEVTGLVEKALQEIIAGTLEIPVVLTPTD